VKRVNIKGETANYPEATEFSGWNLETALDLDMVSAACPRCSLILVETNGQVREEVGMAVNTAASMGAVAISLSWVFMEEKTDPTLNGYFHHPGIPITVASGDNVDPSWPATSPEVISVGGTRLLPDESSPRGWIEYPWPGSGSGCSKYQPKPSWQHDSGCDHRAGADVSADADDWTSPVSVYSSEAGFYGESGWIAPGGTSVSAPLIAGIEAVRSKAFREAGAKAFSEAGQHHELYDVTEGWNKYCVPTYRQGNYLCDSMAGYDGPTGWGTPGIPNPGPPASTEAAALIEPSEATLAAWINPQGASTTYSFEYGTSTTYGSSAPAVPGSVGTSGEAQRVTQKVTGLKPSTEYHYRVSATNSTGTFKSDDLTFTTPASATPAASTELPSAVQVGAATMNGIVNPGGGEVTYHFDYGVTNKYGSSTTPTKLSGATSVQAQEPLTGLRNARTYHYRLVAVGPTATVYGRDRTFTTPVGPPTIVASGVTEIDTDGAYLTGTIAPGGENTVYYFEYGPTVEYGKFARVGPGEGPLESVGEGVDDVDVRQSAGTERLKPATTYHFRLVAQNAMGTAASADETFTTREWSAETASSGEVYKPAQLSAISCISLNPCVTVGSYTNSSKAVVAWSLIRKEIFGHEFRWNLSVAPTPSGAKESRLESVSCASSSTCVAVGSYLDATGARLTLAEHWNGTEWTIKSTPNPVGAKESRLEGVSCASTSVCTAVGSYVNSSGTTVTLAENLSGGTWSIQAVPNPPGVAKALLRDISCASVSECWGVGESQESAKEPVALVEHWSGGAWSIQSLTEPTGSLKSVSCPSLTWCLAVGSGVNVEKWNGTAWSRQMAVAPGEGSQLKGVMCRSQNACTAVGDYLHEGTAPLAEHWDGSAWAVQAATDLLEGPSSEKSTLEGVSCETANGCVAVGSGFNVARNTEAGLIETHTSSPFANTAAATGVGSSDAILNGSVNPNGEAATYNFEYGTTTSYGSVVPTPAGSAGSGAKATSVSQALSGLTPNTTYHFRVVAQNAFGTLQGEDVIFRTLPPCKGTEGKCEWKAQASADLSRSENSLVSLSCASSSMCMAIGTDAIEGAGKAVRWNGSQWSNALTFAKAPVGISCPSVSWCMAIGVNTPGNPRSFLLREEGSTWVQEGGIPQTPSGGSKLSARGISCTTTTACILVGSYYVEAEAKYKPLVERWNGTSWTVQTAPSPATGSAENAMVSVSCASATSCVAVGTANGAPFAEGWNGTTWSIQSVPVPSPSSESSFAAVSCSSASACTAVGYYKNTKKQPLAERWDGSSWSIQTTPAPTEPVRLKGVSCGSATDCIAVGSTGGDIGVAKTVAQRWNGTSWSEQSVPNGSGNSNVLAAVSCSAAGACSAVGYKALEGGITENQTSLAERWNGSEWKIQETPAQNRSGYSLTGVSCLSESICWGVGTDSYAQTSYHAIFERWESGQWTKKFSSEGTPTDISCPTTTWCMATGTYKEPSVARAWLLEKNSSWANKAQELPMPSGGSKASLRSISCSSNSACTAVGTYWVESESKYKPLVERWNGTSWSLQTAVSPPGGFAGEAMLDVSCPSATSCVAVGKDPLTRLAFAQRWNGTSWSVITPTSPGSYETSLEGVACSSNGTCMAVGIYKESNGGYKIPLAERWDGTSWTTVSMPSPGGTVGDVVPTEISCATPDRCTTVGQYSPKANHNPTELNTLAESWNGASWAVQASPNSSRALNALTGVSCSSAITCTAVGSGWLRETSTGHETLNEVAFVARYE
jgi:hypothetical protein